MNGLTRFVATNVAQSSGGSIPSQLISSITEFSISNSVDGNNIPLSWSLNPTTGNQEFFWSGTVTLDSEWFMSGDILCVSLEGTGADTFENHLNVVIEDYTTYSSTIFTQSIQRYSEPFMVEFDLGTLSNFQASSNLGWFSLAFYYDDILIGYIEVTIKI